MSMHTRLTCTFRNMLFSSHKNIALGAIIILLELASYSLEANAEWLSLCQQSKFTGHKGYLAHVITPKEDVKVLTLTDQRLADVTCLQRQVPIPIEKVIWGGFAPELDIKVNHIALQGVLQETQLHVSEVIQQEQTNFFAKIDEQVPALSVAQPKKNIRRSAWFWAPTEWLAPSDHILDAQKELGLSRIYITIPSENGAVINSEELKKFIKKLHKKKSQVWAVIGDPQAILESRRENLLSMAAAYNQYNEDANDAERLDGLQLDIEPYLIPGYKYAIPEMMQKYADVVNVIHRAAPVLPLDIVLPFWLNLESPDILDALEQVSEGISSMTVMDYRTDIVQIRQFASKFFTWADLHQKTVNIALESLAMKKEEMRHYQQAISGELVEISFEDLHVLLLLKQPLSSQQGMLTYQHTHTEELDGSNISFYGHRDQLMHLLPILEKEFMQRKTFSGISLHGIDKN